MDMETGTEVNPKVPLCFGCNDGLTQLDVNIAKVIIDNFYKIFAR